MVLNLRNKTITIFMYNTTVNINPSDHYTVYCNRILLHAYFYFITKIICYLHKVIFFKYKLKIIQNITNINQINFIFSE